MAGKGIGQMNMGAGKGTSAYFVQSDGGVSLANDNLFLSHRKWNTSVNNVPEFIDYTPVVNTYGYNGIEHTFELDKRCTYIGKMDLLYRRQGVQGLDDTTSYVQFHDWEGYSSIDRIEMEYINKLVYSKTGEEMYHEMMLTKDQNYISTQSHLQGHNRNDLEKMQDATSEQWVVVDLGLPFEKFRKQVPIISLPNKIRFKVYFKNLKHIIVTDGAGAPTCELSELILRCHGIHLPENYQSAIFNEVKDGGYSIKITSTEWHRKEVFTATSTAVDQTWSLPLRNIKNFAYEMMIIVRPQSAVEPAAVSDSLDLWNFIIPTEWWIEDAGSEVTQQYEGERDHRKGYGLYVQSRLAHPKSTQHSIPLIEFVANNGYNSFTEGSEDDSFGGRQFNRYNNPVLKLRFKAGHPKLAQGVQYYVDAIAKIHNNVLFTKGDMRRFLL